MKSIIEILEYSDDPYMDVAKEMFGPHISTEQRTIARLLVEALCRHGPYVRQLCDVLVRNGFEPYEPVARLISSVMIDYSRDTMDDLHRCRKFRAFVNSEVGSFDPARPAEQLSREDLLHLLTCYRDFVEELKHHAP